MKNYVQVIVVLCAIAMLCSCGTGPKRTEKIVKPLVMVDEQEYRVGVGDYLEISIQAPVRSSEDKDDTKVVLVLPDGTLNYLYHDVTGNFYVEGKTPDEIAKMLYKELIMKKGIKRGSRISVLPTAIRSRAVYLVGEVRVPGKQPLLEAMTLVQAIATAGGFTEFADKKRIQLIRRVGSREIRWNFNYDYWVKHPASTRHEDMQLKPGDMIIIREK